MLKTDNKKNIQKKNGYTLIELMVVIVIIGILASLGLVYFQNALKRSRDTKAKADLKDIAAAQEQYRAISGINGTYAAIGSASSPYTCQNTMTPEFTMPSSASSNAYMCYQSGTGSFCLSAQLERQGDGNCGGCTSPTQMSTANSNYFCVLSKQ